jgi:small subunit ribosomal protein S2
MRDKETGALEKYTKKERLKLDKEIESLRNKFEGIKDMVKLPEAILVLDMKKDGTAAKEAKKKGIKIIAICDTNIDPAYIDYVIPANDDSISSIKYILEKVRDIVVEAKSKIQNTKD